MSVKQNTLWHTGIRLTILNNKTLVKVLFLFKVEMADSVRKKLIITLRCIVSCILLNHIAHTLYFQKSLLLYGNYVQEILRTCFPHSRNNHPFPFNIMSLHGNSAILAKVSYYETPH